jgi:hypothetical protein
VPEPSKIKQAEANVAALQAALDEAQRVLKVADHAQKKAQDRAEQMQKVAAVVSVISGVAILMLLARHRRLKRAHRKQDSGPSVV